MDEITGAAGAGGTGAGSPPAPGSGVPGSPPDGSAAGSPPAVPITWDTAPQQLRNEYQQTKTKLEPWEKLGFRPEDAQRSHQTYTRMFTEANQLGTQLGYPLEQIAEAFATDPVNAIAWLRNRAAETSRSDEPMTQAQLQAIIDRQVSSKLKPLEQEREQRLDSQAENLFDGEFDRQFKTSFPHGWPDSGKQALSNLAWQHIIDDKDAHAALRGKGDVTAITGAFDKARKLVLGLLADIGEFEKKRISGGTPSPNGPPPQKQLGTGRTFSQIHADLMDESIPLDRALGR